jgi:NitT/TauT family transport system substrate-binding protein
MTLTAAATGVLVLAGCHVLGGGSASGPAVSGTVTVAAAPGVADAPLYIGIRDGLFTAAGLTVRVHHASSVKSELAQLQNGTATIAFADYADLFFASQQNPSAPLGIVADGYDCGPNVMEVLTLPGSRITAPQDLRGKTIGTPLPQEMTASLTRPYSLETTATWAALANVAPSLPASIQWEPMPAPSLIRALRAHRVDAILVTEPTITEAETQYGVTPVLDACSGPTQNLPLYGYVTSGAWAAKHTRVLNAFRSALAKAQADASLTVPVQSALEHYAGMDKETAALVTEGAYPTALVPDNIQRVASLMFFYNALSAPVSVHHLIAP